MFLSDVAIILAVEKRWMKVCRLGSHVRIDRYRATGARALSRMTVCVLALWLLTSVPATGQWPQWRGPGGQGYSSETEPLPEVWGTDSQAIRWRTEIPGQGISSPIVSHGRVFVTTSYPSSQNERVHDFILAATVVLALLLLLLIWRDRRLAVGQGDSRSGRADRWDRRIVTSASIGCLLLAMILAARPDLLLEVGNPGRAWRVGSAIALLGLAAAFGWSGRRSFWRLLGVLVVFLGAFLVIGLSPAGPLGPPKLSKSLPFVFLGCATATWYLVSYPWIRPRRGPAPPSTGNRLPISLCLVLVSVLAFVPINYLAGLQRVVVCLDLETGKILWEKSVFSGPAEQKWHDSTYATPTPATDGEHVFAYFGLGVASVDFEGRVEWREKFPGYSRSTRYGAGASPIVAGKAVVLVWERESFRESPPSWIAAYDRGSGRPLWRIEPPGAQDSYTTPVFASSDTGSQVITASWKSLVSYDAESGAELWSLDYPMEQMVASPARSDDAIAVTGGVYGDKSLMVIGLGSAEVVGEPEILWETSRGVAEIASPVMYDEMLFTVTTPGIMNAYDAESGAVLWQKRLEGEYFASLVAGDGKVYATNTEGVTTVLAAGSEAEIIAVNDLQDRVYASPAIAHGSLLIRTADSLFRIDAIGEEAAP